MRAENPTSILTDEIDEEVLEKMPEWFKELRGMLSSTKGRDRPELDKNRWLSLKEKSVGHQTNEV